MKKQSYDLIKHEIDKYDNISFNIFDTLIKRNCNNPKDIFQIVENKYNKNNNIKLNNFYNDRINAEEKARLKKRNNEEISLDEIYDNLEYNYDVKQELKHLEIDTELEFCQKNESMYNIYKYCKENNKHILCISDMYLDKNIIHKMLLKCGYDIPIIYVSSKCKYVKKDGNLFKYACEDLGINTNEFLHIDDSKKAFLGAKKAKVRPIYINNYNNNCTFINKINNMDLNSNIMYSFINNNISKINNYYERFGYEILGPICVLYNMFINKTAKENNINNLLFCSRDTKLLREIYNLYFNDIENEYFQISRKSSYVPYLYKDSSYENFLSLLSYPPYKLSIKTLLNSLNINIKNCKTILKKYNLDYNKEYDLNILVKNKDFIEFYNNEIIKFINTEGKERYNRFIKYLNSLNIDQNTALVDLGWIGHSQQIISELLNININGIYLGLKNTKEPYLKDHSWTYVFDESNKKDLNKLLSSPVLVETLFSDTSGSVLNYSKNNVHPFIFNNAYNKNNEIINSIHNGAYKFAKDFLKYKDYIDVSNDKFFINNLTNIVVNPSLQGVTQIGQIKTENIKTRPIINAKSFSYYELHPKEFIDDFLKSDWRIGFLKQVFKINIPYYRIYSFIKSLKKYFIINYDTSNNIDNNYSYIDSKENKYTNKRHQ